MNSEWLMVVMGWGIGWPIVAIGASYVATWAVGRGPSWRYGPDHRSILLPRLWTGAGQRRDDDRNDLILDASGLYVETLRPLAR